MSHSPRLAENTDPVDLYDQAWHRTGMMVREGASLSGRERNCLFLNVEGKAFVDVSGAAQVDFPEDGRALATTDWDSDGDLDLFLHNRNTPRLRILRNDWPRQGRFLRLWLRGTESNTDAVGARAELWPTAAGPPLVRTVRAGEAFLSQSSKWIHFTLGEADSFDRLVIHWPSGAVQEFRELELDRAYQVREGASQLVPHSPPPPAQLTAATPAGDTGATADGKLPGQPSGPAPATAEEASSAARVALLARVPSPRLTWRDAAGQEQPLTRAPGRGQLLVLWATWCQPCQVELRMLGEAARELAAAKVDVRLLSVDGLDGASDAPIGETDWQAVAHGANQALTRLGVRFPAGLATTATMERLEVLAGVLIDPIRPWPVPASVLIDPHGQVAVLYRGPLAREQLAADLGHLDQDPESIRAAAVPFPGRWYFRRSLYPELAGLRREYRDRGWLDEARDLARAEVHWLRQWGTADDRPLADNLAQELAQELRELGDERFAAGDHQAAESHYAAALEVWPRDRDALNNLGVVFQQQARWSEAEQVLRAAIAVDPASSAVAGNLASVLEKQGRVRDALEVYREALARLSEAAVLENNLAWTLATAADPQLRQADEALAIARRLCERTEYRVPSYLDTLAAAYAAGGDFSRASATAELAADQAAATGADELAAAIRARRERYLRKEPVVSPPLAK